MSNTDPGDHGKGDEDVCISTCAANDATIPAFDISSLVTRDFLLSALNDISTHHCEMINTLHDRLLVSLQQRIADCVKDAVQTYIACLPPPPHKTSFVPASKKRRMSLQLSPQGSSPPLNPSSDTATAAVTCSLPTSDHRDQPGHGQGASTSSRTEHTAAANLPPTTHDRAPSPAPDTQTQHGDEEVVSNGVTSPLRPAAEHSRRNRRNARRSSPPQPQRPSTTGKAPAVTCSTGRWADMASSETPSRSDIPKPRSPPSQYRRRQHHNDNNMRPRPANPEEFEQKRQSELTKRLVHLNANDKNLVIGDSNYHGIHGYDLEERRGTTLTASTTVLSVGGLCVHATLGALADLQQTYPNYRAVCFGLGTNDMLHHRGEMTVVIDSLIGLLKRAKTVFPNSKIHFLLPFFSPKLRLRGGTPVRFGRMIRQAEETTNIKVMLHSNVDTCALPSDSFCRDALHVHRPIIAPILVDFLREVFSLPAVRIPAPRPPPSWHSKMH